MDKTVMKKRLPTRRHIIINEQQQQSAICGGDLIKFNKKKKKKKKSKKEKVRSLSAIAVVHKSMPSSLPKNKVFNECNGVDHSSVPRKIRSAMKKRGRESILSDSEKLNHKFHGIESLHKDSSSIKKKSKKQVVLGPITKDEQEVAETLYALAGMFDISGSNGENELESKSLPKNSSVSQDQEESINATFEASAAIEDANLIPESSSKGKEKISSLSETIGDEQTDFPQSHNTAPETNLQDVPMTVKTNDDDCKVELNDSKLCLEIGLNVSALSQISHIEGKRDVENETVGGIDCKQEQHIIKCQRENEGPTLWPGLTSSASSAINASCSQRSSAAVKAPHWLNAAIRNSKQDLMGSCSSSGKSSEAFIHKKSWKSCAAHVHIGQLIRSLELPKQQVAKEPELYECDQIRVHQGSKCGALPEGQNSIRTRNGNGFAAGTVHSSSLENFPETKNGILQQQQCHYLDISLSQSQAPPAAAKYGPQKQSFNFLSLSTGGNELTTGDCFNKGESRLQQFSKSQVPYFRSIQQQHGLMPISTPPPSQYTSTYLDKLPAAGPQVRLQQPHYYGTPLRGTHYSSTISYKQQQYQNFWAAQLVAQGGSGGVNCNAMMRGQHPNLQNGRLENSAVNSGARIMLPHQSFVSLESLGSKVTSVTDQQPFSSIPPSRTNGLEERRGRFHGSGVSSLQLLCDERI
ncbi:unnamed protein product [Trifolium pratense]|uniref:Uncharacterized protein n=1 Tax=Trifolium pratense TaxID=57577 RepID=A0ACB0JHJ8_TRIPR|nr:unnamed protein product [Trifolium pratense]